MFEQHFMQNLKCNFRQTLIGLHHYETKELLIQLFYFTFLVGITAVQVSVFHHRYSKQFIWKRAENCANLNESNTNEEVSNDQATANEHKTYLERVKLALIVVELSFGLMIKLKSVLFIGISDSSRHWHIHYCK